MTTPTNKELYDCTNCRVWDPDNQPSVLKNLERNPHYYDDELCVTIPNGMFLTGSFGSIPLHTELMLCTEHKAALQVREAPLT